jgi:serralysin
LHASKDNDFFEGQDGNDQLYGYDGNDSLFGGVGNDYIRGGNGADTLSGLSENDTLYGDAGNDIIDGGAGADIISGGLGKDQLAGGSQADIFIFRAKETSNTTATADTILDFQSIDDINLAAIDANTRVGGNQVFTFIGPQAFHGKASELRYEKVAGDIFIYGDTNGDKRADLVIHLDNTAAISKAYFVL